MTIRQVLRAIYVRPPEPIPAEHRRLLLLVGAAMLIGGYDANIYGMAIPQIQKSLDIAEADVGRIVFLFRLGMIPAIALSYLADRLGRRNLLMATLAGATVATVWTAFAQSVTEFVAAQTLARVCIYTEELLCVVVIAEEFSERTRGWAVGQLGALASLGAGVAALAFGFVNLLPFGWRAIYFLGAIPLLWLLWARRGLVETKRFQTRKAMALELRPLKSLFANYPDRLVFLICVAVPYAFGMASSVVLLSKFLQSAHGWAPGQVATLILVSGVVAIFGNIAAGTLSDRYGRRLVLTLTAATSAASFYILYAWAAGPFLALFWMTGLFTYLATDTIISALGAELFPTSHRSVASAIRLFFWLFAGGLGFLVEAELFEALGSHGQAIAWLTLAAPLCLIPIWFLPETASRSLDDIATERAP